MNVLYAPEQDLFRESVARFVADRYTPELRRRMLAGSERSDEGIWRGLAALGCLGLGIAEADGGFGGGAVDIGIVAEELGKGLSLEPYASTMAAASVIAAAGSTPQRGRWLPAVAEGALKLSLADEDDPAAPLCAAADGAGWTLHGRKRFVADAPLADAFVIAARVEESDARTGLFVAERDAVDLRLTSFETVDGRRAAHLDFDRVRLRADARLASVDVDEVLAAAIDARVAAHCSDAAGCMRMLLDRTIAHTKTRLQFGRALVDNQVLRHRMVDMAIQCEEARASALRAALYQQHPPAQRARAVSGTKVKICRAATLVAEGAIQLHGAMGVTEELDVGSYARRLLRIRATDGTEREHRLRIAGLRARETRTEDVDTL